MPNSIRVFEFFLCGKDFFSGTVVHELDVIFLVIFSVSKID